MLSRLKFEIDPLVNEMLDKLPADVWTSDSTTFLDLAIGGGQFVKEIERRLRKAGHSDENIASRVFGFEKDILAIRFATNKYRLVGTYVADKNVLTRDFEGKQFDVVIGNPPYQAPANKTGRVTGNGGAILWPKFVQLALSLARDSGYVSLIHPPIWRKPGHKLFRTFQSYNLIYLRILNIDEGQKTFGVFTSADWYLLQKSDYQGRTEVESSMGSSTIDIKLSPFISSAPSGLLSQVFSSTPSQKVLFSETLFFSRKGRDTPSSGDIEAYYSKKAGNVRTLFFSPREEMRDFLVPKVIIQLTGYPNFHRTLDKTGKLGLCQFSCALPIESVEDGQKIIEWFDKYQQEFVATFQWGGTLPWRLFQYLKPRFWEIV